MILHFDQQVDQFSIEHSKRSNMKTTPTELTRSCARSSKACFYQAVLLERISTTPIENELISFSCLLSLPILKMSN